MKGGFKAQDFGDFLDGFGGVQQQILGFLETDIEMVLAGTDADAGSETVPQVRVANPQFGGEGAEVQRLLASEGNERMGALDKLIDNLCSPAFRFTQVPQHGEHVQSEGGKEVLVGQRAVLCQEVAVFEALR
jgi:hypothetical protein